MKAHYNDFDTISSSYDYIIIRNFLTESAFILLIWTLSIFEGKNL